MSDSGSYYDSIVDPRKGIYVQMEGIMEVREVSEDYDHESTTEDVYDFQKRVTHIPEDFFLKSKQTTVQKFIYCVVCNCDLKNIKPLIDHVSGKKHIKKALKKKRDVLGLELDPPNAPRKTNEKRERPLVDVGKTLEERLRNSWEPAVGLDFISEYTNPKSSRGLLKRILF